MAVRAKFTCVGIKIDPREPTNKEIILQAVWTDDPKDPNKEWSKYTPYGELKFGVSNPKASEQFELGKHFWLDFSPAE